MSDRLADIKAREQAAFGGPWEALDADENGMHAVAVDGTVLVEVGDFCDAEFIAHAREDVPWLVDQVESLERWKFEAIEVMSGLRELGKALGLRPGVQITGPAALAEVARLTAERDALAAKVARVEALADAADDTDGEHSHRPYDGVDWDCGQCWVCEVRAAVGRADRAGRPHDCRPIYSRSVCGQCGGQEQWCETCSRQMCGCATTGQEGDQ